ncbi:MAG: hypothetical protein ACK5MQ_08305 [Pikeienuella sp.]
MAIFFAAACCFAGQSVAAATTMNFDGLPAMPGETVYVENGVTATATGGELSAYTRSAGDLALHLDDSGTPAANAIRFTIGGALFRPVSFDYLSAGFGYCADQDATNCNTPYDNVRIQGLAGGSVLYEEMFSTGLPAVDFSTYMIAQSQLVDTFVISNILPSVGGGGGYCFDAPCGHMFVDDLTIAPVPLPATLPLLAVSLAALFGSFAARRRIPA